VVAVAVVPTNTLASYVSANISSAATGSNTFAQSSTVPKLAGMAAALDSFESEECIMFVFTRSRVRRNKVQVSYAQHIHDIVRTCTATSSKWDHVHDSCPSTNIIWR
jgi:hypothetical protein